jgi:hypothetical protein
MKGTSPRRTGRVRRRPATSRHDGKCECLIKSFERGSRWPLSPLASVLPRMSLLRTASMPQAARIARRFQGSFDGPLHPASCPGANQKTRCMPAYCRGPNRVADRAFAFCASSSRLRGCAGVTSERIRILADAATSSTARSNAASFAFEGTLKPLSLRTNCSDASRISSSVAGGSKLNSVLMFRHMATPVQGGFPSPWYAGPTMPWAAVPVRDRFPSRGQRAGAKVR